jgi:hypothetical protein
MGRTAAVLSAAINALPSRQRDILQGELLQSVVLRDAQHAAQCFTAAGSGVVRDKLLKRLPRHWLDWGEGRSDSLAHYLFPVDTADDDSSSDVTSHLQAKLARLLDDGAAQRLLTAADRLPRDEARQFKARFRSMSSKGALACLNTLPCNERDFTMAGLEFRETLRRYLGIERPDAGGNCNKCKTKALTAVHARRCGGSITVRHNTLRDVLAAAVTREAGITGVEKESAQPFVRSTCPDLRMDVVIPGGQMAMPGDDAAAANKGALADVALIDPASSAYLNEAAVTQGSAAASKALEKIQHYLPHIEGARFSLCPVVFELFGAASEQTHALVHALATHQAEKSGGVWSSSQCIARWRQRLSVVLQRAVSAAVDAEYAKALPLAANGPRPDVGAYARLRLLESWPLQPD